MLLDLVKLVVIPFLLLHLEDVSNCVGVNDVLMRLSFLEGAPPDPELVFLTGDFGRYEVRACSFDNATTSLTGDVCIRRPLSSHQTTCLSNALGPNFLWQCGHS